MDELDAAAALDGILKCRTLPSDWYTDPRIFELERRHIFGRAWEYVGTAAHVGRPGDYFTCEVAGAPVVVLRDAHGTLRAFLNICRHRHHPVVQGAGNKPRLT
ncbi:MAG TPA: Rieske 2Fe-2S domain-containing protein, partial [Rhodothermales bacterium]